MKKEIRVGDDYYELTPEEFEALPDDVEILFSWGSFNIHHEMVFTKKQLQDTAGLVNTILEYHKWIKFIT